MGLSKCSQKEDFFDEEDNDGVPVQLESVMVERSTTCWVKQAPYGFFCLKKKSSMHHNLFFIYLCLSPLSRIGRRLWTLSVRFIVLKRHDRVCGRIHRAMFSGCYIHMPCRTDTKPFASLCVREVAARCTVLSVFTSRLANSEPPRWLRSKSFKPSRVSL